MKKNVMIVLVVLAVLFCAYALLILPEKLSVLNMLLFVGALSGAGMVLRTQFKK